MKVSKLYLLGLVMTYIIGLKWGYTDFISPSFTYFGYINLNPGIGAQVISFILALTPLIYVSKDVKTPSQVVFWLLYTMVLIPAIIIPDYIRVEPLDQILWLKLAILLALFMIYSVSYLQPLQIAFIQVRKQTVLIGLLFVWCIQWGIILRTFGLQLHFTEVDDVYDLREQYRSQVNRFSGYAVNWQSKIIHTFMLVWGVLNCNKIFIILGIFGQLLIFSITGHKSILLSSVFVLGLLFCLRKEGHNFATVFLFGLNTLMYSTFLLDTWLMTTEFTSIFVRRMLVTPGLLLSYYFDFFSANEKIHLAHSIFSSFLNYPYDQLPAFLIGEHYFKRPDLAANANVWADAYANFGYAGIGVFTLVLCGVLYLYDSISTKHSLRFSALLIAMPAWSLVDTSFITAILTHGILLAIILNYLMNSQRKVDFVEKSIGN
ncbi:hypothetical protein [Listeria booriae]|uniref:hypothetical protein n=1 Tax=Listeria booriae TaxID=1552123 RepID=UPI001624D2B0|nr:hypothetical protein [Listeria booriae]MBC2676733.1 hypothetical protein [Listeria booriae]